MRAINIDVLIEKYGDWYVEEGTEEGFVGNMRAFVYDIVPTADVVERKKGKWVRMGKSSLASCECGFITDRCVLFNFCPNCGADMRGEEDG